jgi:hypothetical protein
MNTKGKKGIEQIVAGRNGVEHALDVRRLLLSADPLIEDTDSGWRGPVTSGLHWGCVQNGGILTQTTSPIIPTGGSASQRAGVPQ